MRNKLGAPYWACSSSQSPHQRNSSRWSPVRRLHPVAGGSSQIPSPTFSVKVNLVRLLTSVRDRNGSILTNLNRDDFQVIDDGVPQDIAVFERTTSVPLSVSVSD